MPMKSRATPAAISRTDSADGHQNRVPSRAGRQPRTPAGQLAHINYGNHGRPNSQKSGHKEYPPERGRSATFESECQHHAEE